MNKKKIMIGKFALIGALVMSAFSWGVINRFNEPNIALANHLTPLTAAEISTLRWNAIARSYETQAEVSTLRWDAKAKFYGAQNETLGARVLEAGDLTSLSAAEVSSLRWNAMARDYETQAEVSTLRWNAMANFYEAQ